MSNKQVLDSIRQTLKVSMPKGGEAILYGSRARGDARPDSDWDVLIILDKEHLNNDDYLHISYPLTMLGTDLNEEINPIMYTKEKWQQNSFTPFYHNVMDEGIRLWAL